MFWCTAAGRLGVLLLILVTLAAPTKSSCLGTYRTIPPPEPNCTEGLEDIDICACDPECRRYGDCCRSSPYFTKEEQRLGASPFTCQHMLVTDMHNNMYVMTKCPPEWNDSDTRNRCEHPDITNRDPLLDAPVTSISTNITYQNWHCAYCHGDLDADTTVIWNARFTCYGFYLPTSVSYETLADHLSFNPKTSEWCLNISESTFDMGLSLSPPCSAQSSGDYDYYETQRYCFVTFIAPTMELPARSCRTGTISGCSENWTDNEVKTQCEEYTARVCHSCTLYRNYHCLLCNGVVVPEPCNGDFLSTPRPTSMPSITTLLDWKRLKRGVCASSEIYDPLSRVCRKVFL